MHSSSAKKLNVDPNATAQTLITGSLASIDGRKIPYWPVEVSQFLLVVLTDRTDGDLNNVVLKSPKGTIDLVQISNTPNYNLSGYNLVRFRSKRKLQSIESALKSVPELESWNTSRDETDPVVLPNANAFVRAARFEVGSTLRVSAKTFGTNADYLLSVKNVSKSGMLLVAKGETPPFKDGTLIELEVDPTSEYFSKALSCLAKVIRSEGKTKAANATEDPECSFAIRFVDLDSTTLHQWGDYVHKLEENSFPSNP
jgi:hypothetical protein